MTGVECGTLIPERGADKKQAEPLFMFAVLGEEVACLGVSFWKKGTFSAHGAFVLHEDLDLSLASVMAGKEACGIDYINHPYRHIHRITHYPEGPQPLRSYILGHRDQS